MRKHALKINLKVIAVPQTASDLDGLPRNEFKKMLVVIFWYSGVQVQVQYFPLFLKRPLSGACRRGDNVSGVHNFYFLK